MRLGGFVDRIYFNVLKFVRKRMKPIPVDVALERKEKLSVLYAISAVLTFVAISINAFRTAPDIHDIIPGDKPKAQKYADLFNSTGTYQVIKYKGFKKVEEYEFEREISENEKVESKK